MDKKKQSIKESFTSSKVRYGGYATLITIVVVVLLLGVNLVVDQIPGSLDMTQNRMYSLSQQTYNILDGLTQDVRIIGLFPSGQEVDQFDMILKKYADRSPYVKLSYVDPVKDPTFSQKYISAGEDIATNDFIVETDNAFRVVDYNSLVNYTMDQNTYQYQADSLAVEQQITSAIQYVTTEDVPKLYMVQGHGEQALNGSVKTQVQVGNYEVNDLTLSTSPAVPDDADVVVLNSPQSDLSAYETGLLRDYLAKDGNLIVMVDIVANMDMPNLEDLLKSYGVAVQKDVAVETEQSHYAQTNQLYLLPNIADHEITSPITEGGYSVEMYAARSIEILSQKRDTLEIVPLLTTSDAAFGETDLTNVNVNAADSEDIPGPMNLAVAVTDHWYEGETEHSAHLMVVGSSTFIQTVQTSFGNVEPTPGNVDLFMNTLGWMTGVDQGISIRPVDLKVTALQLTGSQTYVYAFIAVLLIPLAAVGAGIYVFLRRRHL